MASLGSTPSAPVAYKKKDGVLSMAADHGSVTWTPRAAGGEGAFTLFVKDVTSTVNPYKCFYSCLEMV